MKDVSHQYPMHDVDRDGDELAIGRMLVQSLGVTEPRTPANDSWVRVPLRITHNTGDGFVLEVGPYDFTGTDFEAVEHAVKEMRWLLDHN